MSLAENLLNNMENDFAEYLQEDLEPHIVIDESRIANVPQSLRTIAVTGDKDILTIPFDCARFIDGHDLSTFAIYLNYVLPDGTDGTYIPDSITTSDTEYHFEWLIKNNITETNGKISFAITAIKTKKNEKGETVVDKQWSSIPNGDCSIALGLDISNVPDEEEATDVVAQLSAILEQIHGDVDEWIKTVLVQTTGSSTTKAMSQKATTDALENFLSDAKRYTNERENELNKKHNSNLEKISKNHKMIANFDSSLIKVSDDSVSYAKTVPDGALPYAEVTKIGGMSYRDETAGVLKNAAATGFLTTGANLLKVSGGINVSKNGATIVSNNDGSITVNGTPTEEVMEYIGAIPIKNLHGIFTLSGANNSIICRLFDKNGNYTKDLAWGDGNFEILESEKGYGSIFVFVYLYANVKYSNAKLYPMVNLGYSALPHVPFKSTTIPLIPENAQMPIGYELGVNGEYNNYIEWKNGIKTFNQCVKKTIIIGTNAPVMQVGANGDKYAVFGYLNDEDMVYKDSSRLYPSVCNKYPIVTADQTYRGSVGVGINHLCAITAYDKNLQTAEAWQAKLQEWNTKGTPFEFIYAIKTPIVTDISDLLSDDNLIEVSEGGLVIAENADGLDAPTTIVYRKEKLSPSDLEKIIKLIN